MVHVCYLRDDKTKTGEVGHKGLASSTFMICLWLIMAISLSALLASAQVTNTDTLSKHAASPLVLPHAGGPLSLEQTEEWSRPSGLEIIESQIYRDSAGKVLMKSERRDSSGGLSPLRTILIDPVAGSTTVMIDEAKTAYRMPGPKGDALLGGRLIADDQLPAGSKWISARETAGKRTIEDFVFDGIRIIQVAPDKQEMKYTLETWYSDELKLTGLEQSSGPKGTYTARIKTLHREEPDSSLFVIPAGYKIVDVDVDASDLMPNN